MSTEDNKALVRRFYDEVINENRLDLLDEIVTEDFTEETPLPGQEQGREGLRRWFETVKAAYPDMHWDVEEMIAEADNVALRAFINGTSQGPLMGMGPTGKRVRVEAWVAVRFRNRKISGTRFLMDTGSLMQQLGVIPPQPATTAS